MLSLPCCSLQSPLLRLPGSQPTLAQREKVLLWTEQPQGRPCGMPGRDRNGLREIGKMEAAMGKIYLQFLMGRSGAVWVKKQRQSWHGQKSKELAVCYSLNADSL